MIEPQSFQVACVVTYGMDVGCHLRTSAVNIVFTQMLEAVIFKLQGKGSAENERGNVWGRAQGAHTPGDDSLQLRIEEICK